MITSPDWFSGGTLVAFGATSCFLAYAGIAYAEDIRKSSVKNKPLKYAFVGWFTASLLVSGLSAVWRGGTLLGLN